MDYYPFSQYLRKHTEAGTFGGINNCRMAAYFSQLGHCYITGRTLPEKERQLHHRHRRYHGGPDTPENTILLDIRVHHLIHSYNPHEIESLLMELALTESQFRMVNQLRLESHMFLLKHRAAIRLAA